LTIFVQQLQPGGFMDRKFYENPDEAIYLELVESNRLQREVLQVVRDIRREIRPKKPLTHSIAIHFTGDSVMANNTLVLNVGQTSQASIVPLLADGVTPSGGALSNVVYTFSDPSATVVLNSDGVTATVSGVAASSGPVAGSASCTVTDTDGAVSTWNQPFTVTTNAVTPPPPPPSQLTQSVAVEFTTPTP
jgi:hypothetical protein